MRSAPHAARFRLDEADLQARTWRFGRDDGGMIAPYLRLLAEGRFGGYRHHNEWRWGVEDGTLVFFNIRGERSTVFDKAAAGADGCLVLSGSHVATQTGHVLTEIPFAGVPMATDAGDLELVGLPGRGRRYLVVLRADDRSLHHDWPRDVSDADRSWDFCVSHYGSADSFARPDWSEWRVHQPQLRKFAALHALFHAASPLWDYDYVMFPDDDLMMSWSDLNICFELCREHRLDLAQPALKEGSFWGLQIVLQQPGTLLRYVDFVECMTPIFSVDALRLCITTFPQSRIGWGLDVIWPSLIGPSASRVAILDAVAVLHTRPVGASYGGIDPGAGMQDLLDRYGARLDPTEYGRLLLR